MRAAGGTPEKDRCPATRDVRPFPVPPSAGSLQDRTAVRSRADRRAGRLRIVRGKNVATVVRETEQEYEPPLTRHSPAAAVVLAYLRDQVAAISRYDPRCWSGRR